MRKPIGVFTGLVIIVCAAMAPFAASQTVTVEPEITMEPATTRHSEETPEATLGAGLQAIALPPLPTEEWAADDEPDAFKSLLRIGTVRELPEDSRGWKLSAADWVPVRDGALAWSLSVSSPGAHALRLRVAVKDMPDGARLVCYDAYDPHAIFGPFAAKTLQEDGLYWTPTVFSDNVVLEWQLPHGAAPAGCAFLVDRVVHTFLDPKDLMQV
jgi:hypothetical protein